MRVDKYTMAQSWMRQDDATPDEAKATWDTLETEFEDKRKAQLMASAETDEIIKTINDKFGPGTMFPASEAPIPPMTDQQAIFEFGQRNPQADGGRIGFEKGLLVSDLTPNELTAAQVSARRAGISGKKDSKEFADFVGGDTYKRRITMDKEWAEEAGFDLETWKKMNKKERARAFFNKKYRTEKRTKAGNVVGDTVEEIVIQLQKGGTLTKQQKEKKMLYDTYADIFKEEFNKLKNLGEPFSRRDLTEQVIARIEEKYTTPDKYFNEDFLPTRDLTGDASKSWYDFISPSKKSDAKKALFPNIETANKFFSQESTYLRRTATQEKVFDLLAKGVNEIDDIAAELEIPRNRVKLAVTRMLRNMYDSKKVPAFLQNRQDNFGDVADALENSKSLEGYKKRNIRKTIYETFPEDSPKIKTALKKINEFDSYIDNLKKDFPGLKINYDHPASYQALKNQNLKGFLNITPIQQDLNNFKSQFDLRSQLNLGAMEDALAAGNMEEYKKLLQKQRGIERLWSNLTGGQSTLGRVRLGKATNLGTKELLDGSKNLIKEFEGNLSIRENIARNIDPSVKFYDPVSKTNKTLLETMDSLFPVAKGQTKLIERTKKLTSPELLDMDKQVSDYITGKSNKMPKISSQSGFISTDLLGAPQIKALMKSEGFKKFSKVAKTPGKFFGIGDIALGYLDFLNNKQKGQSDKLANKNALQAMSFGLWKGGDRERLEEVRELAIKNGMDGDVFDSIAYMNEKQNLFQKTVNNAKWKYDDFKKAGMDKDAEQIKIDAGKRLTEIMGDITTGQSSLQTNVRVDEAGAPIDINVDDKMLDAYKNVRSTGIDYRTKQAKDAYETQKRLLHPEAGKIGNWLMTNIFTTDARRKAQEQAYINDMEERELYLYNQARGISPDQPLSGKGTVEFMLQNPKLFGSPTSYSTGGIAGVKKVDPDELKEAQEKMKKLMKQYKNKNLDWDAVKRSYKIWTK